MEHYDADKKPLRDAEDGENGVLNHEKFYDEPHSRNQEIEKIDAIALSHGTTMASFAHLDEKKILRKMDMRLIPMLAILYLLSFLDRGNIGNAKIEGLQEDLKMTAPQYNVMQYISITMHRLTRYSGASRSFSLLMPLLRSLATCF